MVEFLNRAAAAFVGGFLGWNNFTGRTRRRDYWYFTLVLCVFSLLLVFCMTAAMEPRVGGSNAPLSIFFYVLYLIFSLATLVPSVAMHIRRLHDTGRSGWWFLGYYIPLVNFAVLFFTTQDSEPGTNKWGPNPKDYEREIEGGLYDNPYPNRAVVEEDW